MGQQKAGYGFNSMIFFARASICHLGVDVAPQIPTLSLSFINDISNSLEEWIK